MAVSSELSRGFSKQYSLTAGEDFPVKIPLESIQEHFSCPVCKGTVFETCLTTCGHRYCRKCIVEWVGRRHECPICRDVLSVDDLISDKLYDELLETILKLKKKEEEEYFKLAAMKTSDSALKEGREGELVSPLEGVLRRHLKKTLQSHEEYHQQLLSECKKSQARAYKEKALKIDRVIRTFPHDPDHPERLRQMKQIEIDWDERKKSLEDELIRIETILASTYDKYLERNLPSPSTLPVSVTISVPQKKFTVNNVIIKPSDTMGHILNKLQDFMKEDKIDIAEFPPCEELQISLLSPFSADLTDNTDIEDDSEGSLYKPKKFVDPKEGGATDNESGLTSLIQTLLHSDCRPVMEYGLKSGSEIRVEGKIVLEGEQPRICFAASFVEGQNKHIDYFACKTCRNTTWICQHCANVCHKGHELIPHRMNHLSKWACCYCDRKTDQCRIFRKN